MAGPEYIIIHVRTKGYTHTRTHIPMYIRTYLHNRIKLPTHTYTHTSEIKILFFSLREWDGNHKLYHLS